MSSHQATNPFCKPVEHTLSRRHLLGAGAAASAIGLGGLGGLVQPLVAEQMQESDSVPTPEQRKQGSPQELVVD